MKTISRLKLNNLNERELKKRELAFIRGGVDVPPCACVCACHDPFLKGSTSFNTEAEVHIE